MRQVTFTVPDEQYAPLMKVLKALPFAVEIKSVPVPQIGLANPKPAKK